MAKIVDNFDEKTTYKDKFIYPNENDSINCAVNTNEFLFY